MPEARRLPWLAGALGRVRVAVGTLWLDAYIRRNRRLAPELLLASTWSAAERLGFFFAGGELFGNRFGHRWPDILFLEILRRLSRAGVRCVPKVSVSGFDAVRAVAEGGQPVIAVMRHSPTDTIINRLFDEAKIPWTLLAAGAASATRKARLLGLAGDLDVIPRNDDALLAMRQRLGAARSICACVDFAQKGTWSARSRVFVSPALFELAKLTRSAVVYADAGVLGDGVIELVFAWPRVDVAASTAEACAKDFIDWLRTERLDRRKLVVRRWINTAAGKGKRSRRKRANAAARKTT